MATITAAAVQPVSGAFATSTPYSGTFIPTLWSSKMNVKFYAASVFGEIANTNWEGEIKSMGDKVIINNVPSLTVRDYIPGAGLTYEVPVPSVVELAIDKGKYFAFQVNDVLEYQAKPDLMNVFSDDAAQQMRTTIDSTVIYNTFTGAASGNYGATAGVKSSAYNVGTDASPVNLATAGNVLQLLTNFAGILDEQNVPETDRWLVIDPATRQALMKSNIAQAQYMGDTTSIVRNGKIGMIDRFTVYVSNQLPRLAANGTSWISGDGSETTLSATTNANARRAVIAGHKSAITFASQMTKTEQVRNPYDFGDYIRGLNIFGYKVVKGEALAYGVVYGQ